MPTSIGALEMASAARRVLRDHHMDHDTATTLRERIDNHSSVTHTTLFYTNNDRVYETDSRFNPTASDNVNIEIQASSNGLHPDVLKILATMNLQLVNSLVEPGRFRTRSNNP